MSKAKLSAFQISPKSVYSQATLSRNRIYFRSRDGQGAEESPNVREYRGVRVSHPIVTWPAHYFGSVQSVKNCVRAKKSLHFDTVLRMCHFRFATLLSPWTKINIGQVRRRQNDAQFLRFSKLYSNA